VQKTHKATFERGRDPFALMDESGEKGSPKACHVDLSPKVIVLKVISATT